MNTTPEPSGNGARRERKSEKTRRRILDAAAEILSRDGFAGTRLAEIAAAADLRVPAVYYYFDSREAILEEVVLIGGRLAEERVRAKLAALPADATAMDRICAAFGGHLEMVLKESAYTAAAMRTMAQLPPDVRARQLREHRAYGDLWRSLIMAAHEAGELDPGLDPHGARMFLMGAVNWAPEWWKPERGGLEETVATAERLVRNALTGGVTRVRPDAPGPAGAAVPVFTPPPPPTREPH
ncbi:TetR/AcrR family transcriptional regulator [Pseudonocardia sp. C8]|uniref:TetR/AcrR family transcriptional regulator n=1 Tax=Pseudonocardia sp. C8 TaxID=2762759 RepID=UPI00351C2B4E